MPSLQCLLPFQSLEARDVVSSSMRRFSFKRFLEGKNVVREFETG